MESLFDIFVFIIFLIVIGAQVIKALASGQKTTAQAHQAGRKQKTRVHSEPVVVWEKNQDYDIPPPIPPLKKKRKGHLSEDEDPVPAEEKKQPRRKKKSRNSRIQNLRKAVIWSEILAPPLALRDDKENWSNW